MRIQWDLARAIAGLAAIALIASSLGCQADPPTEPTVQPPVPTPTDDVAAVDEATDGEAFQVEVPLGLPPLPIPDDNPMTEAKVELGKLLYFDPRLSADGTISCATCHDPQMAWTEHRATSEGIEGLIGDRNSPTVINSAYATVQFWDGRAASLEEQALGPIENPIEMGHTVDAMISTLSELDVYTAMFQEVFGTGVTAEGVAKAIAAFERTILSGNSPYDQFQAGDEDAMTEAQQRGWKVFEDAGCITCHTPPLFSNYRFYNAGIGMDAEEPDPGRKGVTDQEQDMGAFRVPALREVAKTHPYFHNGSVEDLRDAVAIMAGGGIENPYLSAMMKAVASAELTDQDIDDLTAFMHALSGDFPIIDPPELP